MNSRDVNATQAAFESDIRTTEMARPNFDEINLLILAAESSAAAAQMVMDAHAELAEAGEPEALRRYSEAGELALGHLRRRRMWLEARRLQVAAEVVRPPPPAGDRAAA